MSFLPIFDPKNQFFQEKDPYLALLKDQKIDRTRS